MTKNLSLNTIPSSATCSNNSSFSNSITNDVNRGFSQTQNIATENENKFFGLVQKEKTF